MKYKLCRDKGEGQIVLEENDLNVKNLELE